MQQDIREGFTRQFWSHMELAEGLHLSRGHLYRLVEKGQMLGPDIVIAPDSYGWEPNRALRFGVDTDRLNADFQPLGSPSEHSLVKAAMLAKGRYSKTPDVYLSSWLVSYAYDLQKNATYFMRKRNTFMPADVMIAPRKFGWSEPRTIEFGEQSGRLNDELIDKWVIRRTAEFGLSPEAAWVQKWLDKRRTLVQHVEGALEQWRASQYEQENTPTG